MPETREVEDSARRISGFIVVVPEKERIVTDTWVDLTDPDLAEVKRSHPASSGMVFALEPTPLFEGPDLARRRCIPPGMLPVMEKGLQSSRFDFI